MNYIKKSNYELIYNLILLYISFNRFFNILFSYIHFHYYILLRILTIFLHHKKILIFFIFFHFNIIHQTLINYQNYILNNLSLDIFLQEYCPII